ncbi:MAG: SDR family oxidoreductase [Sphingobacteriales bacterium]|nr:MAG: SDR family oxidoreductase [Sphingobacteriales bacterium]
MKVFIAGASGLVGGQCLQYFSEKGWDVTGSYFSYPVDGLVYYNTLEADENNFDLAGWKPDVIVHCGALTHVDYCESHIEESYLKTVKSTETLVEVAKQIGAGFVYFSTDYVFDGISGPYKEEDSVNPLSVYGQHKLEGEQLVLREVEPALVLRVTNIYGDEARGKNFVARIVSQIEAGTSLTLKLPYDQFAHPTNAADLARALYLLLRDGKRGIYHLGGTDYMNRVELALRILKHYPQASYQLEPISTASLQQPAARPLNGGFIRAKFCAEYPEFLFSNVDDYLNGKH